MSSKIKFNEVMLSFLAEYKRISFEASDAKTEASNKVTKAQSEETIEKVNQSRGIVPEDSAKLDELHDAVTSAQNLAKATRKACNKKVADSASAIIPDILYPAYCAGLEQGYNVNCKEYKDSKGNITVLTQSFHGYLVEWLLGAHLATGINEKSLAKLAPWFERYLGGKANFNEVKALGKSKFNQQFICLLIDYIRKQTGEDIVVAEDFTEAYWDKVDADTTTTKAEENPAA